MSEEFHLQLHINYFDVILESARWSLCDDKYAKRKSIKSISQLQHFSVRKSWFTLSTVLKKFT